MTSVLRAAKTVEDTDSFVKMILYGNKGSGKTYMAGLAPDPIVIDTERSTETFKGNPQFDRVKVLHLGTDIKTVPDLVDTVEDAIRSPLYRTIVLDTVTRLQIWQMRQYMDELVKKSSNRDRFLPYQGDFRISLELLDEMFMKLQQCQKHVILTAHERKNVRVKADGTTEITRIYPDLIPSLSDRLTGLFHTVGYLTSKPKIGDPEKKQERTLQVNPGTIIDAKNRLGIQQLEIKDPTFESITTRRDTVNVV